MTRKNCSNLISKDVSWLPGKNYCGNHPHNFYIQILAETGIIGFLFAILMIFSIIYACYKERIKNPNNFFSATVFVIPLAIFFPLQNVSYAHCTHLTFKPRSRGHPSASMQSKYCGLLQK